MTNSQDETPDTTEHGISDEQLPEDLTPADSPLAEGLEPGETAGDIGPGELLTEGKTATESDEQEDSDD